VTVQPSPPSSPPVLASKHKTGYEKSSLQASWLTQCWCVTARPPLARPPRVSSTGLTLLPACCAQAVMPAAPRPAHRERRQHPRRQARRRDGRRTRRSSAASWCSVATAGGLASSTVEKAEIGGVFGCSIEAASPRDARGGRHQRDGRRSSMAYNKGEEGLMEEAIKAIARRGCGARSSRTPPRGGVACGTLPGWPCLLCCRCQGRRRRRSPSPQELRMHYIEKFGMLVVKVRLGAACGRRVRTWGRTSCPPWGSAACRAGHVCTSSSCGACARPSRRRRSCASARPMPEEMGFADVVSVQVRMCGVWRRGRLPTAPPLRSRPCRRFQEASSKLVTVFRQDERGQRGGHDRAAGLDA